jgi:hypothetical protein
MAVAGFAVVPYMLLVWHVAHWVDSDTLLWNLPGFQLAYPDLWQLSQLVMATPVRLV